MWQYSDKVKEHFLKPRNVGEIKNPDGAGEEGSMACGDALRLTFKVDEKECISEIKFQTFGCASAIASASALTELAKGMHIDKAEKLTNDDIVKYLDGLPAEKIHCSVLGAGALRAAIHNYRTGEVCNPSEPEGKLVCHCFGITEEVIEQAVREHGLDSIEMVTNYTKAGGGCGMCADEIEAIIRRCNKTIQKEDPTNDNSESKEIPPMTNIEKIQKISAVIENTIKPALAQDGGSINLVDVVGDTVKVELTGACAGCPMSQMTLSNFVQAQLQEQVSADLIVQPVR